MQLKNCTDFLTKAINFKNEQHIQRTPKLANRKCLLVFINFLVRLTALTTLTGVEYEEPVSVTAAIFTPVTTNLSQPHAQLLLLATLARKY